jgi:hypothetical protein
MVLQDLFDTLAGGEFAQLSLANSVTGSIKEEAYPKIVNAINRSLREVYKKLLLKKKKILLYQQTGVSRYYLRADYLGDVGSMGSDMYIVEDEDDPFTDDLIRILGIVTDDADGEEVDVPLNPTYLVEALTIRTAAFDTLDLITTGTSQIFTIEYQATYPKILITEDFDPEVVYLYYPPFIEEALTNYIASLLVKGKVTKASEGEGYATNTFTYKYDKAIQKLIDLGLAESATPTDTRFENRGWV